MTNHFTLKNILLFYICLILSGWKVLVSIFQFVQYWSFCVLKSQVLGQIFFFLLSNLGKGQIDLACKILWTQQLIFLSF
jgi:hypothetical protein